ncbi:16008_t:CDS:2 [Cetraspora pellucida]|uniref:16008_t:CDS:1 n=1 Tax=Cetraspora pellucida TaxID=1433469 RepID=A0A9N9BBY0_9GLOM|nr:16008_t:CDS:2 [Cetraspora pellucida]
MFEATFAKAALIKYFIKATRELVTNINIKFTEFGINFTSINLSHISLSILIKKVLKDILLTLFHTKIEKQERKL